MTQPSIQEAQGDSASPPLAQGEQERRSGRAQRIRAWAKRIGFWGCVFFTLKGISWLVIPVIVAKCFRG